MIVGLSGKKQAGKDTAAQALIERGWTRQAFADKLKQFAYALNPYVQVSATEHDGGFIVESFSRYAKVVDAMGLDKAKHEFPDIRRLLQRLGTEAGRQVLGDNVWVDAVMSNIDGDTVITDVRFPNEADAISNAGGVLIRITRPGLDTSDQHPSETALDGYEHDAYIANDGSIDDLHDKIIEEVEFWVSMHSGSR